MFSYPLKTLSIFISKVILGNNENQNFIIKEILAIMQDIIRVYIIQNEPYSNSTDMDFFLGDVISLTHSTAIPFIFDQSINNIKSFTEEEQKDDLTESLIELSHELWHFYDYISVTAAEYESLMVYYIGSNLYHISIKLLNLYI